MTAEEIIAAIKAHGLLVRPSFTGHWRCGVFLGVTGLGQAYSVPGTECEEPTLEDAVAEGVRRALTLPLHRG